MSTSGKMRLTAKGRKLLDRLVATERRHVAQEDACLVAAAKRQAQFTYNRLLKELAEGRPDGPLVIMYAEFKELNAVETLELDALGRLLGAPFKGIPFAKREDEEHMRRESPGYVLAMTCRQLIDFLQAASPP